MGRLQLSRRRVRTNQHESPTNRLSESSCTSECTKVEQYDRSGGGNPSLVVERLRLFEKKEDISVEKIRTGVYLTKLSIPMWV